MNFYPVPPTLTAQVHVRIPDSARVLNEPTEWRGGLSVGFENIFLEGPVVDDQGNLYVVDIPYGRILKIDKDRNVTSSPRWDGNPNGLAATKEGDLVVADYKEVSDLLLFAHSFSSPEGHIIPYQSPLNFPNHPPALNSWPLPACPYFFSSGHPQIQPLHPTHHPPLNAPQPRTLQRPQRPLRL